MKVVLNIEKIVVFIKYDLTEASFSFVHSQFFSFRSNIRIGVLLLFLCKIYVSKVVWEKYIFIKEQCIIFMIVHKKRLVQRYNTLEITMHLCLSYNFIHYSYAIVALSQSQLLLYTYSRECRHLCYLLWTLHKMHSFFPCFTLRIENGKAER